MKRTLMTGLLLLAVVGWLPAADFSAKGVETNKTLHSDGKGWGLVQAPVSDPSRPRVLLVGDSILSGYFEHVKKQLEGRAYVDAWLNPYYQSDSMNARLSEVMDQGPYDVVHLNTGLHGWTKGRIKEGTFEPLTKAMIEVIKSKSPKAKIIWASSTPITTKGPGPIALNAEKNPVIIDQNRMAAKVMAEMNVPVNDFYALLADKLEMARGDEFHWKDEAYPILGKACADSILKALNGWQASARSKETPASPVSTQGVVSAASPAAAGVVLSAKEAAVSPGAAYFPDGNFIGAWRDAKAKVKWELTVDEDSTAKLELVYSCAANFGGKFLLEIGAQKIAGETKPTGGWENYAPLSLGGVTLAKGKYPVTLSAGPFAGAAMNLREIRLAGIKGSSKAAVAEAPKPLVLPNRIYVIPNYHPASCGWLANFSNERNYCANNYLEHLDRVRDDVNYNLVISEVNNMMAILNFTPGRFEEIRQRVKEGRVEAVNGFFLEPSVSISGGEALAKMGVEGRRWQRMMLGVRPRYCWMIDTAGIHDQMPQICAQLGLEALIYNRCAPVPKKNMFWSESPDGSRVLTIIPGTYANNLGGLWPTKAPVTAPKPLEGVARNIETQFAKMPANAPTFMLGGHGDYSMPPARRENPSEFLDAWKKFRPGCEIKFSTFSAFFDELQSAIKSGKVELPSARAASQGYAYQAFWIQGPRMKQGFRRDEHALQAAEMLAAAASLQAGFEYPARLFYLAWLQMLLNMDRNTLWASAAGMVFESPESWDVKDRLAWVENQSAAALKSAARKLAGAGKAAVIFNAANWKRTDPLRLQLPPNTSLSGVECEAAADGTVLCQMEAPASGIMGVELKSSPAAAPKDVALPAVIETKYYAARIDPATGALVSLKTKPSGYELLGGPANVIVAEKDPGKSRGNYIAARAGRTRVMTSSEIKGGLIRATEGTLAITVEARGTFVGGGELKRVARFFKNHPRIEFETELNDIPDLTVVSAEFALAGEPAEMRRGIPFGFSRDDNYVQGIVPAVRFTDYATPAKGGLALLDRGVTGRDMNGKATPVLFLMNASDKYSGYPNAWTSGKGRNRFEYAFVPHEEEWTKARIPQMAWEYNTPVTVEADCGAVKPQSFIQTTGNVIVEALRRDGADIELRLVECMGVAANVEVTMNLPHESAAMTDMNGENARKLEGGPVYKFPVKPMQIVTLRCKTAQPVPVPAPLTKWDEVVPEGKRAMLGLYKPDMKGHPPHDVELQVDQGDNQAGGPKPAAPQTPAARKTPAPAGQPAQGK